MINSSKNYHKKIKCRSFYLLLALFGFLSLIVWTALLVSVIKDKAVPLLTKSHSYFHLESYNLPIEMYRKLIPGMIYEAISPSALLELNSTNPNVELFNLGDLLSHWSPDNVDMTKWIGSAAHYSTGKGIPRFDYRNDDHMIVAMKYRNAEIPFVVYNVPEVVAAINNQFSLNKLLESFGDERLQIDQSVNKNHFTYYRDRHSTQYLKAYPTWKPPQIPKKMTFKEFLNSCEMAETQGPIVGNDTLHYLTISAARGYELEWIRSSFPFFRPKESFFIVDPEGFKGINCRFGQKGVVATAHYDAGRNFVVMLRGRKRYILLPPSECKNLHILPRGHPSSRHSELDWSDLVELQRHEDIWNARATEVLLGPGDVLYIPGYWFHYIMSQDASIQCNARSGDSDIGRDAITDCGMYEKEGEEEEEPALFHRRPQNDIRSKKHHPKLRKRHRDQD